MTQLFANVELSVTFDAWRNTTNQVIDHVNKSANNDGIASVTADNLTGRVLTTLQDQVNLSANVVLSTSPNVTGSGIDFQSNVVFGQTGAIRVPEGTTAQRIGTANGYFRYNKTTGGYEGYSDSGYVTFVTGTGTFSSADYVSNTYFQATYTTADVQSKAALANTNAYIDTKLDSSAYTTADVQSKAALANILLLMCSQRQL
jgi:hypothetical protein